MQQSCSHEQNPSPRRMPWEMVDTWRGILAQKTLRTRTGSRTRVRAASAAPPRIIDMCTRERDQAPPVPGITCPQRRTAEGRPCAARSSSRRLWRSGHRSRGGLSRANQRCLRCLTLRCDSSLRVGAYVEITRALPPRLHRPPSRGRAGRCTVCLSGSARLSWAKQQNEPRLAVPSYHGRR